MVKTAVQAVVVQRVPLMVVLLALQVKEITAVLAETEVQAVVVVALALLVGQVQVLLLLEMAEMVVLDLQVLTA
jgi:hypothetical protein